MSVKRVWLNVVLFLTIVTVLGCKQADVVPKTPEQLLTATAWKLDELRYLQNNVPHYYKRDGTQNTESFSEEYIEFFSDNTGKYSGQNSSTASLTWGFTNPEKTMIQYTLSYGLRVTWENVILSEK